MLNLITRRRLEAARVDTFLAAIRATAVPAPVRPLPLRMSGPAPARTDTASLPRIVVIAGSVLVAGVVLAGCAQAPASTTTAAPSPTTAVVDLQLPVTPEATPAPEQTGTDAGLITDPAPGYVITEESSSAVVTTPPAPAVVTTQPATVQPVVPVVAPPAAEVTPEPAPEAEPSCAPGEELQGDLGCVAVQLPEEQLGGARCEDPAQVVVAVLEDGTAVCGAP